MNRQSMESIPSEDQKTVRPKANKRTWVSINLVAALFGMIITGIMSYTLAYSEFIAGVHTWFAIGFTFLMVFHLRNNLKTIFNYVKQPLGKRFVGASLLVSLVFVVGVLLSLPPFNSVLEFGKNLRKSVTVEEGTFQTLTTNIGTEGLPIAIELRKGRHYESDPQPLFFGLTYTAVPQVAFWLEDLNGNYINTIYVTQKVSNGSFVSTDDIFNTVTRPESLPYWAHQRGVKYGENSVMPGTDNNDLDGVTGATPLGNYAVRSQFASKYRQFKVMMEINRSYDFNQYYSKNRFPEDPIYSGSGSSGQPSLIYSANINLDNEQASYIMKVAGHGHYSGANGNLYTDMTGIDTALELIKRVVIDI
jgi:hypothetical protein